MTSKEKGPGSNSGESKESIFKKPSEHAPTQYLEFLRLAEREGAYERLPVTLRHRLEYYINSGMTMRNIAKKEAVSVQAISQSLTLIAPKSLFISMEDDIRFHRASVPYSELILSYSNLVEVLDPKGTRRHKYFRRGRFKDIGHQV